MRIFLAFKKTSRIVTRGVTLRGGGKSTGTEIEMGGGKAAPFAAAISGSKIVIGKCEICVRDW